MPEQKVHAVVLRYANYKESSRMLTLFSLEQGVLSVAARGCRRTRSPIRAGCELLTFGEYLLHTNRDRHNLRDCTVLDPFFDLREDLDRLATAMHLRDLCDAVLEEGNPQGEVFSLLIRCLGLLCHEKLEPALVQLFFEVQLMNALGLMPQVEVCVQCGGSLGKDVGFSITQGGAVCAECRKKTPDARKTLPGALATLRQMAKLDTSTLPMVRVGEAVRGELDVLWRGYLSHYLERRFGAADFARRIRPGSGVNTI